MIGNKLPIDTAMYKHYPAIHNFNSARQVLPYLLQLTTINSILDVGCGTGTWLYVAAELGVKNIKGIDGAKLQSDELKIPAKDYLHQDLTEALSLNQKYDLVICLEVAEHLPPHAANTLINSLTTHSDLILFSAAIPGQDGQNHLNEQWPDYWQTLFKSKGFFPSVLIKEEFWDNENVDWWYRQNMLLFGTKAVLDSLGLPIVKNIQSVIHPRLFDQKNEKINELNDLIKTQIWHPTLKNGLKTFLRSIFKW
ncbi:class I SAM-dependent methyltransferase [Mucilaginibacter phyllosphaerae]|uniref:SAM-dependent methyltransferase n=1 Tax=Mucilaginibacter phyllosphaerae TaxID=1812349 RepID=A0A4Y8AHS5_9SPHI|nr:class I SAM-dependent methyltransferase [Mucilaginibacter phyllosphaerae]MBB3968547.1 SAM-dependent methyltransferase [Mucilaginibacter phyllosphaerae]TEW67812.1 class I SAM-dependent methyltransferase [Mucilaginibacter phyllosphaerae]GGH15333.1 hypothetical protein GCM10007352_24040 [Mucilaginibacter phyllosphaerae]